MSTSNRVHASSAIPKACTGAHVIRIAAVYGNGLGFVYGPVTSWAGE